MVNQLHQLTTPVPLVPPGTSGYPQGRDWFIIGYILLSLFRLGIWGGSTPRTYIGPIIFWGWASICQLFKLTRMHFVGKWMYHFCCQICWGMLGLPTLISLVSCRVRKIRICMYFYTDIGEETYVCLRDRPLMTESEVGVLLGQPHWFLDVRGFRWKAHTRTCFRLQGRPSIQEEVSFGML
jgi:hypothetical protein